MPQYLHRLEAYATGFHRLEAYATGFHRLEAYATIMVSPFSLSVSTKTETQHD